MNEKPSEPRERDILFHSLSPALADWADFETRFLGKTAECLSMEEVTALASGRPVPEEGRKRAHLATSCRYCNTRYTSARAACTAPEEALKPRPEAAAWLLSPPPATDTRAKISTIVELPPTDRREPVSHLQPALARVLDLVGLAPTLEDDFRQFLLSEGGPEGHSLLEWLGAFARKKLDLPELPRSPSTPADWIPVLNICAMHQARTASGSREIARVLQEAEQKGYSSPERLLVLREENPAEAESLNAAYWEVRSYRKRFKSLLGLNVPV